MAHPTDSKLLETARAKLVEAAQGVGIELKQTFAKEGQLLRFKAGRYAHARQFKRMRRVRLTPRQTGTGGKTRQLGISKRGDPYVRTMLMHGARV